MRHTGASSFDNPSVNDPITLGRESIRQGAGFDTPFVLSNLAATVIACAGLVGDSSATVIGAMLVATLMGPIMGIGLALVDFDDRLLRRSLATLVGGALMVLATGILFGRLAPDAGPTHEMLARTSPRVLDLIVALASGAICAYAVASPRLSAAIVGVSIAVALVPPLATAGLFAAHAQWELAHGAFRLAFVNMVAIQVGASVALWLYGYRGGPSGGPAKLTSVLRRGALSIALMLGLVAILARHEVDLLAQQRYEAAVRETLAAALAPRPEARLADLLFTQQDGRPVVIAVVRSPARFTSVEVRAIGEKLPHAPDGMTPRLRLRHLEVDVETEGP
jgi:uncharacterized hydrophobic protein (TIGR00271 family)